METKIATAVCAVCVQLTCEVMSLTQEQIDQFHNVGYLIINDFFKVEDLQPVQEMIEGMVGELATKLYDGGKIQDKFESATFKDRLTLLNTVFPKASVLFHLLFGKIRPPMLNLWTNPKLLDSVAQLLGGNDIEGCK